MKNLKVYDKEFLKKKVVPFALATSLFSGGLSYLAIDKSKDADYVEMSDQVRQSVYYDNPEFSEEYTIDENSNIDESINDKSLELVENLDIDLMFYEDIDYLEYCKNLKTLVIRNAQFLRNKDAKYINNLRLKELTLSFNSDHIDVEGINNDYDFKNLKCNRVNIGFDSLYNTELKNYMLYIWGKKTFGNNNFNFENKDKYEEIDKKINTIIRNKSIRKKDTDEDTLMSALLGVCDYFKYDDKSYYAFMYDAEDTDCVKRMLEYNTKDLSSTLLDYNGFGVCVNVTSLLNAVLYKLDMESYVVDCTVMGMGHEMSIVNINDDWKYIDATNFDDHFKYGELGYKEYEDAKTKEEKEKQYKRLKTNVIKNGDESYKEYIDNFTIVPYIELDELTEKDRRIIVDNMINEELEGTNVEHEHDIMLPIGIGFGTGLIIMGISLARRRHEMKEELSIEKQIREKKEKLIKVRDFLKNNRGLLTATGGVASADYYAMISDFSNESSQQLFVELSMGLSFVASTMVVTYLGSHLLVDYLDKKQEDVIYDTLKKETKKNQKKVRKFCKELEKSELIKDNKYYVSDGYYVRCNNSVARIRKPSKLK